MDVKLLYVERSPVTMEANAVCLVLFSETLHVWHWNISARVDIFTLILIYGTL
jgi:hypothetical protein